MTFISDVAVTFYGETANKVVGLLTDNCACKTVKEKPPKKIVNEDDDDDEMEEDDEPQFSCTGMRAIFITSCKITDVMC